VVTGVREVRSYVARPAAIEAAIEKFYRKNPRAFVALLEQNSPVRELGFTASTPRGGPSAEIDDDFSDPFAVLMGPAPSVRRAPTPRPMPAPRAIAPPTAPLALDGTIPGDDLLLSSLDPRVELDAYLETLNVFVTLLERDRDELRGHSARVAQVSLRIAER